MNRAIEQAREDVLSAAIEAYTAPCTVTHWNLVNVTSRLVRLTQATKDAAAAITGTDALSIERAQDK